MQLLPRVIQIIAVTITAVSMEPLSAQDFPNKPIRIVTGGVGGGGDFVSRLIAQGISGPLGQPVIVENRGAGGAAGVKGSPDGYTLLNVASSFWTAPLFQKTLYDPVKDFVPITLATTSPTVLVVHPSVPATSVKELIALAKARPGELNYSTGATGAISHLAPELFKFMAGINMVRIPYKSGNSEMTDLLAGQVQLTFGGAASVVTQIKTGKLRALAVTSIEPSALFPGMPTVAATLPGYEATLRSAIFAPAKTPEAVIRRLNQEIVRFLNQPDSKARLLDSGVEAQGTSPGDLAAMMNAEIERLGKLIKAAGIKVE